MKLGECQTQQKGYLATKECMEGFIRWVKKQGDVIVAIEGMGGLSKTMEKALRSAKIVFYSFKAADVDKFRKVVLGQNKNKKRMPNR